MAKFPLTTRLSESSISEPIPRSATHDTHRQSTFKCPYLIILDEPCQGLDPINRSLVLQLIENIAARNIAEVIYISQDDEDSLACITHLLDFISIDQTLDREAKYKPAISQAD